jgi:UDPglucose 6-dehydrogenase
MNVSVIGLGKLGATLAAVLADAGNRVYGVDTNVRSVDAINAGLSPVNETGLADLIAKLPPGQLTAHVGYKDAIENSEITMIVVPTPSGPNDKFINDYVVDAITNVGHHIPHIQNRWHTVVVCSTVMPGASDAVLVPALEQASGGKVGTDLGYVYSPEFIALGSVIWDMQHPDVVLIGAQDNRSESAFMSLTQSYVKGYPNYQTLRYSEAELAKIAVNTYVTMKISFASTVAEMAERLPGASATKILEVAGQDTRIGNKYLKPGAAFGGPCFPRDNRAFAALADDLAVDAPLAIATDQVNRRLTYRIAAILREFDTIAVLGLAYKPDTSVYEESMGLTVAKSLFYAGAEVRVHDPQARPDLPAGVTQFDNVEDAIAGADVVLVATPWTEYQDLDFKGVKVLDAWGCVKNTSNHRVVGTHCWWWT